MTDNEIRGLNGAAVPIYNIQRLWAELGYRVEASKSLELDARLIEVLACEQIAVAVEANERDLRDGAGSDTRWRQANALLDRTRKAVRRVQSAFDANVLVRRKRDIKLWEAVERRRRELERLHGLMTEVPATSVNRGSKSHRGVGRARNLPI